MNRNIYGDLIEPEFVDLDGNEIKRNPFTHPYSYDEFVIWKDETFSKDKNSAVYSDRLYQWDSKKYNKCCEEIFQNQVQRFDQRNPERIEKFLCMYFDTKIKLTSIVQGCNLSSGFPYWIFFYDQQEE